MFSVYILLQMLWNIKLCISLLYANLGNAHLYKVDTVFIIKKPCVYCFNNSLIFDLILRIFSFIIIIMLVNLHCQQNKVILILFSYCQIFDSACK